MTGTIARTEVDDIREQAFEECRKQGREEVNSQGEDTVIAFFSYLYKNGRKEEAEKASQNPELCKKLLKEFKNNGSKAKKN